MFFKCLRLKKIRHMKQKAAFSYFYKGQFSQAIGFLIECESDPRELLSCFSVFESDFVPTPEFHSDKEKFETNPLPIELIDCLKKYLESLYQLDWAIIYEKVLYILQTT